MLDDAQRWARTLEAEAALFEPLRLGARIGLVAESIVAGRSAPARELLVWERGPEGMRAAVEPYTGFESAAVDLLIALDDEALRAIDDAHGAGFARTLRRLVRGGHALFFARLPRAELEDAGYDDLLDEIGFAYLGTCR
jgi:hypothetical protein